MFSKILTFTLASLAVVNAVDICAWSNTLGCSGVSLCCGNNAEHSCCSNIPAGFGFSIQYTNLPGPVSDGQAWTGSNCVDGPVFTDQIGTGTKCFVSGGQKINSASWTHSTSKRAVGAKREVVSPNIMKYSVEGVEKVVAIPAGEGHIETMLSLYKAGNFTGIEAYAAANCFSRSLGNCVLGFSF